MATRRKGTVPGARTGARAGARGRNGPEARPAAAVTARPPAKPRAATPPPADDAAGKAPRAPQQTRGRKRVDQILDAAEAVIAAVGIEAATTHAIAERSGSSVGSLYHFFPSKDAIVQALARRFQASATEMNARAMPDDAITAPLAQLFERIVMNQVALIAEHPAFQAVHDAVCYDPRGQADFDAMRDAIVGQVLRFLGGRYPGMPKREREPVARLSVSVVQHVLDDARAAPRDQQDVILRELQAMLVRYFAPLDAEYGVPSVRGGRRSGDA